MTRRLFAWSKPQRKRHIIDPWKGNVSILVRRILSLPGFQLFQNHPAVAREPALIDLYPLEAATATGHAFAYLLDYVRKRENIYRCATYTGLSSLKSLLKNLNSDIIIILIFVRIKPILLSNRFTAVATAPQFSKQYVIEAGRAQIKSRNRIYHIYDDDTSAFIEDCNNA